MSEADPHGTGNPGASTRRMLNFMVLLMPFGLTSGFIAGALGPHLRAAGLSMGDVTAVTAATTLPHLIKFVWAPVVDLTLSRKAWYWIGAAVVAGAYFGLTAIPVHGHVGLLTSLVIAQAVAASILGMALDSLLAHHTTPEQKGKAAGWFQAGNLTRAAIGGALGLWLIDHVDAWVAGSFMAASVLGCGVGLFWIEERGGRHGGALGPAVRGSLRDLWRVLSSRHGLIAVCLFAAPIGIGSLPLAAAAADWHVSHQLIEIFNGWIGPPTVIVGCLVGGRLSDRMDRAFAYLVASMAIVVTTVAFAILPHTAVVWVVVGGLYNLRPAWRTAPTAASCSTPPAPARWRPSTTSSPRSPTCRSGTWAASTGWPTTAGRPTAWSGSTPPPTSPAASPPSSSSSGSCAGGRARRRPAYRSAVEDRATMGAAVLGLDDPRWSQLDHAYGPAGNIPDLLRAVERGEQELWDELVPCLCHQGTVYTASYAAVPHIVRIGVAEPLAEQILFWSFVGAVAVSREAGPVPDDLRLAYEEALARAQEVPRSPAWCPVWTRRPGWNCSSRWPGSGGCRSSRTRSAVSGKRRC